MKKKKAKKSLAQGPNMHTPQIFRPSILHDCTSPCAWAFFFIVIYQWVDDTYFFFVFFLKQTTRHLQTKFIITAKVAKKLGCAFLSQYPNFNLFSSKNTLIMSIN